MCEKWAKPTPGRSGGSDGAPPLLGMPEGDHAAMKPPGRPLTAGFTAPTAQKSRHVGDQTGNQPRVHPPGLVLFPRPCLRIFCALPPHLKCAVCGRLFVGNG